jgi:hypothetical protein
MERRACFSIYSTKKIGLPHNYYENYRDINDFMSRRELLWLKNYYPNDYNRLVEIDTYRRAISEGY